MLKRIRRFSVYQTAKFFGVLYFILGLIAVPFLLTMGQMAPGGRSLGPGFAIAVPFVYGILGFITTAIGAGLYNLVSGWVGGIELEVEG